MKTTRSVPIVNIVLLLLAAGFIGVMSRFWLGFSREGQVLPQALLNLLILTIPIGTVFFSLGLLLVTGAAILQNRSLSRSTRRLLYWTPRLLGLLFVFFVSLFALDTFGPGVGFWQGLGGLLIHLIPSYILLALLFLAWRREWFGCLACLAAALGFILFFGPGWQENWALYLLFAGPLIVTGLLFGAGWLLRRELRPPAG